MRILIGNVNTVSCDQAALALGIKAVDGGRTSYSVHNYNRDIIAGTFRIFNDIGLALIHINLSLHDPYRVVGDIWERKPRMPVALLKWEYQTFPETQSPIAQKVYQANWPYTEKPRELRSALEEVILNTQLKFARSQ